MASTEFNWLHLSDLHWGGKNSVTLWPQVEEEFYKDLEKVHKMVDQFDVVIFSGDLTNRGTKEEFKALIIHLQELFKRLKELGSENVKFLCVPGNHDLVRKYDCKEAKTLASWFSDEQIREEFFGEPKSKTRSYIKKRFENYKNFLTNCGLPFPDDINYEVIIPGDFSATIEKNGCRFGFIGLNSAFLHLSDEANKYNIAVDVNQFNGVCADQSTQRWCNENTINMLVTHHPPEWLTGADKSTEVHKLFKSDIAKSGRFHAHLYGHVHETKSTIISVGGGSYRRDFQGISLFGLEKINGETKRIHGYSAGKVIIKDGQGRIRWWPRIRNKKDDESYVIERDITFHLKEDGGYFESDIFVVKKCNSNPPDTPPPKSTKTCSKYSAVTEVFGRETVIADVITLLKDTNRRLITLLGPPGIGKTTIASVIASVFKDKVNPDFKDGVYCCSCQGIEAKDSLTATISSVVTNNPDTNENILFAWLENKECLLILDNFEDTLADMANVESFIEKLLKQASGVKLLITSRESINLAGIEKVVSVETLTREYSERLISKLADDLTFTVYLKTGDLNALLVELGDVPLAIVLAASNLALGVDYLTKELQKQNIDVLTKCSIKIEDATKDKCVAKSFLLSYSKIEDNNERLLFHICSLFPAGLTKADAQEILPALKPKNYASLISKSLISCPCEGTYTMLALTQTYAYGMFKKMSAKNKKIKAIVACWIDLCVRKSIDYYNKPRGKGTRAIKELIRELPDMFRVLDYLISKSEKDSLLEILFNLTDFSRFVGITKEVMAFWEKASQIAVTVGDITNQANCIQSIGDIKLRESRNKEAMESYNKALPLYKQVGDILGEANCIQSIGHCVIKDNQTDMGIEEVFKAIKLYEKINDKHSIGNTYMQLGRELEEIEGFQEKSIEYKKTGEEILNSIERAL
ncbi:MAG: metallophosphoesterase [Nitrospirota bacterium]